MPYSEKERIFKLSDSTVVAVKPNLLSAWLESHEGATFEAIEAYLVQVREKRERDMRGRQA